MKFPQDTAAEMADAPRERGAQQARDNRVEVVRAADLREEPRPARMRQGRTADGGVRAADVLVVAFRNHSSRAWHLSDATVLAPTESAWNRPTVPARMLFSKEMKTVKPPMTPQSP